MTKIGIIGFGNMGSCLAEKLKSKYEVYVFDKDKNKIINLSDIKIAESNIDLVNKVDVVILAIKPQDFENVLNEIKNGIDEKLVISIAAGITTEYIEKYLGKVRVIRTMPNIAARIGQGMICLCKGSFVTDKDLNFSLRLFKKLGTTFIFSEDMMDAATAISGSGPAYFYDYIDSQSIDYHNIPKQKIKDFAISFKDAAESIGFSKKESKILVDTTIRGSLLTVQASDEIPSQLKKQITSKGGTTEAGLEILHKGGSLKDAVKAARDRARELSKK